MLTNPLAKLSFEVRQYLLVTCSYWGFTLTDGALRMLVILHFHNSAIHPCRLPCCFCSMKYSVW